MDWRDFNGDGEIDEREEYFAYEMLCGSKEEHEALFGPSCDAGEFDDDDEEDDNDIELELSGLDRFELEMMDEDERNEVLEEAGLDPDDFDF